VQGAQQKQESTQPRERPTEPTQGESVRRQRPTESQPEKNDANKQAAEELEVNRKLANFTELLVFVGFLQLVALACQAIIFWRTLNENRSLIQASQSAANAALTGAQAATTSANAASESNALTRESNATTAQATDLTRQSLVLSHRPRLIVRNLYPDAGFVVNSRADGRFRIVNSGGTTARVTAIYATVILGWNMPAKRPFDGSMGERVSIKLRPGESLERPFQKNTPLMEGDVTAMQEAGRERGQGGSYLHVAGFVDYQDDIGTPRTTTFGRRWNVRLSRFEKIENPDYEQED
jgi:hypothetical protein